jgi:hypothetical protein
MTMDHGPRIQGFTFAPELFGSGFLKESGPCRCSSNCCSGGVYADLSERDQILALKEKITPHMDETQCSDEHQWFDDEIEVDADFASGHCIGTAVINDKCVFLNAKGHCSIQLAAVADGLDRWAWKPLFCVLFPIEITDKVVGFDPMLQDEQPCCSTSQSFDVPLFRACKDELTHLLGEAGYAQLDQYYEGLAKEKSSRNI